MSYTSKYTGQQIDNAVAEIPVIKNNINTVQGEISTIKNTTIQSLSGEVATVKSQINTLRNDLNINFNEHDNYELSINRIDNSLNTTIDNLGTLQNLVANKVGIATYNDKMSELEKKDGELASLIAEGDLNTLNSCVESINIISSRISTSETDILTNKTNIATITNTTIPQLESDINNVNTKIATLDTSVRTITSDYVTSALLNTKQNEILNSINDMYATEEELAEINNTLNNSYYTSIRIEELLTNYVAKDQYDNDIQVLNDTISSLEKKLDELEKKFNELEQKIDNNEGWPS